MTAQISRLVRNLVRSPLPAATPTATLKVGGNTVPITLCEVGSGTAVFSAELRVVPLRPCILTIEVADAARIDFPVRITAVGDKFRAEVDGAALVLRRRLIPNAKLQEALAA